MIQIENQASFSGNAPTDVDHLLANVDVPSKHEILKVTNKLDDRSIESIRNSKGLVEGSVIFNMLLKCMNDAQNKSPPQKIAAIHPNLSSLFTEPNANVDQFIQSEEMVASKFMYGPQDFDVVFIPFHNRQVDSYEGGEHWMLGIYDAKGSGGDNYLYFYDPKPKLNTHGKPVIDPVHRQILRHILSTTRKLKGKIILPRIPYNIQPLYDTWSCGVLICHYAKQYVEHGRVVYDPNLNIDAVRQEIYALMESIKDRVNSEQDITDTTTFTQSTANTRVAKRKAVEAIDDIKLSLEENTRELTRIRVAENRKSETEMQRERRLAENRRRQTNYLCGKRRHQCPNFMAAMKPNVDYKTSGEFNMRCIYCSAIHYSFEPYKKVTLATPNGTITGYSFNNCCAHGNVSLPIDDFPDELRMFFLGMHPKSKEFMKHIRNINSSFSFASFNADDQTPTGGIYSFRVQNMVYHRIDPSVHPSLDEQGIERPRRYGALYFVEFEESVENRLAEPANQGISRDLMEIIERVMREHNPFAASYRMMKEVEDEVYQQARNNQQDPPNVSLIFTIPDSADPNRHNAPTSNDVAVVMLNYDETIPEQLLVVHQKGQGLKTLSNMSPLIEPFVYPLVYPNGTFGYKRDILLERPTAARKYVTRAQFARYRLAFRPLEDEFFWKKFNSLHFSEKVFQQWCDDNWCRIEHDKITWIRNHQKDIKANLYDSVNKFLADLSSKEDAPVVGKTILPSTFTGSPRYYAEAYEDAIAIVRKYGRPHLFLTMTCNPDWPEIQDALIQNLPIPYSPDYMVKQAANFRPDIIAKVCKKKIQELMDAIEHEQIFGRCAAFVSVVEFQKRGLPHMHLLVILEEPMRQDHIDDFIKAEIPETDDPVLREIVLKFMIHNPCGALNDNASCMRNKKGQRVCRFKFPKDFCAETSLIEDEMPMYRRRYDPRYDRNSTEFVHELAVYRKDRFGNVVTRDNRHVVPYNPYLLKRFNAHINVEYVGTVKSVKYLYKYIYKGHDIAALQVINGNKTIVYDEAGRYVEGRCVTSPEACWRIYEFELQYKSHSVMRLHVHLKGQYQNVRDEQMPEDLIDVGQKGSTLEAFFKLNKYEKERISKLPNEEREKTEQDERHCLYLTYVQIPEYYWWDSKPSKWVKRKKLMKVIGRIHNITLISNPELFHLRLLLLKVKGPCSFEELLSYEGVTYQTYKQVCDARGFTQNDDQWKAALNESKTSKSGRVMRTLFAQICIYGEPSYPNKLWEEFQEDLAEEFIRSYLDEGMTPDDAKQRGIERAYRIIANTLQNEATGGRRFQYWVDRHGFEPVTEFETEMSEQIITCDEAASIGEQMYNMLNPEQKAAVDSIFDAVEEGLSRPRCFFIDGPGGTGKTFVYKTLYYLLKAKSLRVKNMAFTGIAATLLPEGRTAHKTFALNVPLTFESRPKIQKGQSKGDELAEIDVFFLDEAPMMPRYGMEIMDETLRAVHENNIPFGGVVMVFGGDFRQCTPVQSRANRTELISLTLQKSTIFKYFKVFKLETNQRVDADEIEFANYLLKIGNNELPKNDLDEIEIPKEMLSNGNLVEEIFGTFLGSGNYQGMEKVAILSPLNKEVSKINADVLSRMNGKEKTYYSTDTVKDETKNELPIEYVNSIDVADLPPHELKLKKDAVVILLRNLDVNEGLCNGTRLKIKDLCDNLIKAEILTGEQAGKEAHIPRIQLESSKGLGFVLQRSQFPVRLAFAVTIHKSQGQTLESWS